MNEKTAACWRRFKPYLMAVGNMPDRFACVGELADRINADGVEGDVMECGVWKGGSSMWLYTLFPDRTIYVADSFAGCQNEAAGRFPLPPERLHEEKHHHGKHAIPLAQVRSNFQAAGIDLNDPRVVFVPGFYRDSLFDEDAALPDKLAFLRVDCDSHSAHLEVLHALYGRVASGGIIYFDDFGFAPVKEALSTFFMARGGLPTFYSSKHEPVALEAPIFGCYIVKPRE